MTGIERLQAFNLEKKNRAITEESPFSLIVKKEVDEFLHVQDQRQKAMEHIDQFMGIWCDMTHADGTVRTSCGDCPFKMNGHLCLMRIFRNSVFIPGDEEK